MHKTFAALAALALAASVQAEDGIRPVVGSSLTFGGKSLATMKYEDGTSQTIHSGGLIHLFGGFEFRAGSFALQGNVGYHVDSSNAKNGDITFSRFPFELIGFGKLSDQFRLGVGVRKATSVKLSGSGVASNIGTTHLGSKAGWILQGEYLFNDKLGFFGRYVHEDYTVGSGKVDGSHGGIGVSYRF